MQRNAQSHSAPVESCQVFNCYLFASEGSESLKGHRRDQAETYYPCYPLACIWDPDGSMRKERTPPLALQPQPGSN